VDGAAEPDPDLGDIDGPAPDEVAFVKPGRDGAVLAPYRVSSIRRRLFLPVLAVLAAVGVLWTIFTDPNGTRLANVALWSVLLAWALR
jgi:hypothetical protein